MSIQELIQKYTLEAAEHVVRKAKAEADLAELHLQAYRENLAKFNLKAGSEADRKKPNN